MGTSNNEKTSTLFMFISGKCSDDSLKKITAEVPINKLIINSSEDANIRAFTDVCVCVSVCVCVCVSVCVCT